MKLSELDERSIQILEESFNFFTDKSGFYFTNNFYEKVKYSGNEHTNNLTLIELQNLVEFMVEKFEFCEPRPKKTEFYVNKLKFNNFQNKGGIREYIQRERTAQSEQENYQAIIIRKLELQIKQLERATSDKFVETERRLKVSQEEFHITTTKKNNRWMWTSIVAITLSLVAIVISILMYFY